MWKWWWLKGSQRFPGSMTVHLCSVHILRSVHVIFSTYDLCALPSLLSFGQSVIHLTGMAGGAHLWMKTQMSQLFNSTIHFWADPLRENTVFRVEGMLGKTNDKNDRLFSSHVHEKKCKNIWKNWGYAFVSLSNIFISISTFFAIILFKPF